MKRGFKPLMVIVASSIAAESKPILLIISKSCSAHLNTNVKLKNKTHFFTVMIANYFYDFLSGIYRKLLRKKTFTCIQKELVYWLFIEETVR